MATLDNSVTTNIAEQEMDLKQDKSRAKSNFTRARNKLLFLLEEQDLPSRREVKELCQKMDSCMETAMDVMTKLSDLYRKNKQLDSGKKVIFEMEKLEDEFYTAYESAREYLDARKDERSSVCSEIMSVNMLHRMNITDPSETYRKEETWTGIDASNTRENEANSYTKGNRPIELSSIQSNYMGDIETAKQDSQGQSGATDYRERTIKPVASAVSLNPMAASYEPKASTGVPSIGQDLWRQLKRVQIPIFSGDKRTYQSWKAAFLACIDSAPATAEYKLLQLRQYLSGEALKVIQNLGHSATAYEAAKERLERKYGGKRRQIAIYLEDLEHFRQIRSGNARDMEQFADLLDIAIINLKEAGQHYELGDGSLYTKLQRKLPEAMLARYHRWIFENNHSESVTTLRTWVIQESEFQTIASETVRGLTNKQGDGTSTSSTTGYKSQRTFFGGTKDSRKALKTSCKVCTGQHGVWHCNDFIQMSVSDRWNTAKQCQLCYRCLADGHQGKSCPRSRQCGKNGCRELHHRLLHKPEVPKPQLRSSDDTEVKRACSKLTNDEHLGTEQSAPVRASSVTEGKDQQGQTTMMAQNYVHADLIGLRTVPVIVKNGDRSVKVNALLDDASTKTYINTDVAAELGLQGKSQKVTVNVLNGQVETFETKPVSFMLSNLKGDVCTSVTAYTANRVTGSMTVVEWNKYSKQWPHLKNINFPVSAKRPIVDILIGLDCAELHYSIEEVRGNPGEPIARLTPLGWTCIGSACPNSREFLQTNFACTYFARDQLEIQALNATLQKFWEIEDVSPSKQTQLVNIDDQSAMKIVENSISYESNMYRVGIPWKRDRPFLPDSYNMALRRLENTEKRLHRSPEIATAYTKIIEQYIEKGYVRKVPENERANSLWHLPHFPVLRPDKDTTKTRIVFDASARSEGISLNDAISQGPKLQMDLFDVLLRFRKSAVAVVCDIAEMYLRIGIATEDKPYHRFLWRGINSNRPPDVYEFDRVVFGVNSSPFQAQYVLQHARKHQKAFPIAAETILKSTYMDDSMDSVPNEDKAIELYKQLSHLLTRAGMHARKWLSNSSRVLAEIPVQDRKAEVDLDRDHLPSAKTLGVWWIAGQDVFTFKENAPDENMLYTKRNFLKKIATLFDPIGLLAPFTIRAKILLQEMWTSGVEWDDELTEPLVSAARSWFKELQDLRELQNPRCLVKKGIALEEMVLHTFVDASEDAYGAVVYARCTYADGSVSVSLVAAKTRVAPSLATSIPRLELMGAIVGVRLTARTANILETPISSCTFWSDSVNVLCWIRGRSREFKPFVANRVGEIQGITRPDQWRYVPSALNPADILSRGSKAKDLANCARWWNGPEFLCEEEDLWPINKGIGKPTGYDEMKRSAREQQDKQRFQRFKSSEDVTRTLMSVVESDTNYMLEPERYSSWLRLTRIQAWINRFIHNCKALREDRTRGVLHFDELKRAEILLIRHAQRMAFKVEWKALSVGKRLPSNSKLLALRPKLDDDGLMRSDGRLMHAKFLSYDVRYPVILPRKCWVTKLIVKDFHEKGKHATGTNQTLAAISSRFWIMSAREEIREWEVECAECRRRKAKAAQQVMAPLPLARVKPSLRAFSRTSVDFGGPFITVQGRGKRRQKRYLCLFTCMTTRAVHLEMAYGLDTDSFLNAFYRMASRRGLPEEVFSDNGTNFKGADKELKSLVEHLDRNNIEDSTANKGITWKLNPPFAPHFGGVHETMIKSAKRAIHAILGNAEINDEELWTAMIGAEALINSRPLTYQSANPSDDVPLTPNHFLHGQIGGQFAPTTVDETDYNPRKRWRRIQELVRHFWRRWLREWLPGLGARKKWTQQRRDLQVGEVVLVVSPDTSRGNWPLGRVLEVYPGQDGRVRVAKIQIGQGTLVRPVTKLCPLELDN